MGRSPTAVSLSCIHLGLCPFFTPRIYIPLKILQPEGESFTSMGLLNLPLISGTGSDLNLPIPAAARSLATPITPKQSGRFASTFKSMTGSLPKTSAKEVPFAAFVSKSKMPLWSSERPSSRPEHIIPKLSIPRILPTLSVSPFTGITQPGLASTPFKPTRTLGAPHTICKVSLPVSTARICKWSESGWSFTSLISAIIKSFNASAGLVSSSSSSPIEVSLSVNSFTSLSVSKWLLSQLKVSFIISALR